MDTDHHALVPQPRLIPVGAEDAVPPGQAEAEVAVGLVVLHRVMHAVHVRRHQQPAQHPVHPPGQAEIAVIEHGGGIENDLEQDHPGQRRPQQQDGGELDQHRQDDLDGMEARPGGHIVIQIGMMNAMEAPQQGHRVNHDMLQVDHQVHGHHGDQDRPAQWQLVIVQQPPALTLGETRHAHGGGRKQQAQHEAVEKHQPQVVGPAPPTRQTQAPSGGFQLPQRHQQKHAKEETEPQRHFVRDQPVIHATTPFYIP